MLLLNSWGSGNVLIRFIRIDKVYRPTCKNIISFAFSHEYFKKSELSNPWWYFKDYIPESLRALTKANILTDISANIYTVHSSVEKQYLAHNMNELK